MLGEKWPIQKVKDHLYQQSKEEKIMGEDAEDIDDKVADPSIAVMLFIDHDEEVLAQDCCQSK